MGHKRCLVGLLLALQGFGGVLSLAVMSVDLGSEWMKIAVVSPGMPMEICLNRDSQRKTPVVVAFRDGERQFGDLALTTQTKFPAKAFSNFLDLLGKP
ncbi:hypoxia up-regulated protein 1-like, partial [Tropilaelaps mercedesae]